MTETTCARAWQAEAVVDGRLAQGDAESFQRHALTCVVCTREQQLLAQLSAAGDRLSWPESTPLSSKRQRNELLRKANELTLEAARQPRFGELRVRLLAVAVIVCGVAAFWSWPRAADAPRARNDAAPSFRLQSSEGAVWRTLERGPRLRLAVERGHFELAVDALRPGQRFLVALPEGELEVQGTRFTLDVDGERTQRVDVQEGRVALRLEHSTTRVLSAGDTWTNWAIAPVQTVVPSAAVAVDAGVDAVTAPVAPRVVSAQNRRRAATAGAVFARGMEAFKRADFVEVEAAFRAFERDHPRDARAEDALFLRTLAAARRGDEAETRSLAQSYLERYPNGLRRSEVERMAR